MQIFLDTSDIKEVKKYNKLGIICGVTTNPTLMKKAGIKDIDNAILDIVEEMDGYPVSVEVTSNDKEEMLRQGRYYSSMNDNINIKIPIHGPNGELDNIEVIKELNYLGIKVNATAMMNAQQCVIAMNAGAYYLSMFCGRINDMGYDSKYQLGLLRRIINKSNEYNTEVIAASCREVSNILEWFDAGADIVTVPPAILDKMIVNARSKETVQQFLDDVYV